MPSTLDPSTDDGTRSLERLESELIGWLTTVNPDGQPQSSPIWFQWTDGELLVFSRTRAPRNGNIEERPLVSFNLNTDAEGEDVLTVEGEARIVPDEPPANRNPAYVAKYQALLDAYEWTPDYFAEQYSVAIRIRPTRWRFG
jgi:PPOX class probable F420-dependent enzyme